MGHPVVFGVRPHDPEGSNIDIKDKSYVLEEFWGQEALDWVEKLLTAQSIPDRIEVVEQQLSQILAATESPAPTLVYQSLQYIYEVKGNLSVTELADKVNFSERHLRRAFELELGLSPKEMLGIVRFQSVLGNCTAETIPV